MYMIPVMLKLIGFTLYISMLFVEYVITDNYYTKLNLRSLFTAVFIKTNLYKPNVILAQR